VGRSTKRVGHNFILFSIHIMLVEINHFGEYWVWVGEGEGGKSLYTS